LFLLFSCLVPPCRLLFPYTTLFRSGLIVPVIRNADEKNVLGLQRSIVDLAGRARSRQLKPDEVAGGTFSITNFGSFGSLVGTPVDRKSTRLNSSHGSISYAVFCLKK